MSMNIQKIIFQQKKKRKTLIVFGDMIANMDIRKSSPIVTELFL